MSNFPQNETLFKYVICKASRYFLCFLSSLKYFILLASRTHDTLCFFFFLTPPCQQPLLVLPHFSHLSMIRYPPDSVLRHFLPSLGTREASSYFIALNILIYPYLYPQPAAFHSTPGPSTHCLIDTVAHLSLDNSSLTCP